MPNKLDLTGQKFGKLTVISEAPKRGKHCHWNCVCECGNKRVVRTNNLRMGTSKSCGCVNPRNFNTDRVLDPRTGKMVRPDGYHSWKAIQSRCYTKSNLSYADYGGRGITVCDRWRGPGGLANFLSDMGTKPTPLHSVERVNPNGNYCPENCVWADKTEQSNNRRGLNWITHNGRTMTITQWNRELGLAEGGIEFRLRRGWSIHEAISTPRRGGLRSSPNEIGNDRCLNQGRKIREIAPEWELTG